MTRKRGIILILVAALIGGGIAYADHSHKEQVKKEQAEKAAAKIAADKKAAEEKAAAEEAAAEAADVQANEDCHTEMDSFVDSLTDLNSKIGVGMVYSDYLDAVGEVSVEYGRISFEDLSIGCVKNVGLEAEKALNRYSDAADYWGDTIENGGEVSEPELQKKWSSATRLIEHVESGFDKVKADSGF